MVLFLFRESLKAYISRSTDFFKTSPPHTPEEVFPEPTADTHSGVVDGSDPLPLFCDVKPFSSSFDSSDCSIDYIPPQNLASQYIDLPLMNFEQDQVVADRKKDLSILEIPSFDYIVPERAPSPPQKEEIFMFPPNFTSIVGLRTFLLNRRNLLNWANENVSQVVKVSDNKLEEIKRKFDERIWCLFLWPALMSRYEPSCSDFVFLDDETVVKKNSFLTGMKKPSASVKRIAALTAANDNEMPSTSGLSKSKATSSKPKNSEPAEKKRKVVADEEDDDPDDPDEIMDTD